MSPAENGGWRMYLLMNQDVDWNGQHYHGSLSPICVAWPFHDTGKYPSKLNHPEEIRGSLRSLPSVTVHKLKTKIISQCKCAF
jgi:hypothetical protein